MKEITEEEFRKLALKNKEKYIGQTIKDIYGNIFKITDVTEYGIEVESITVDNTMNS